MILVKYSWILPQMTSFAFDVDSLVEAGSKKRKAAGAKAGASEPGSHDAAASSSDKRLVNLMEKLTIVQAKETSRLSREVAELKAMNSVCVLVPSDCSAALACKGAAAQYAEAVKGNPKHDLGPCDFLVCKALLTVLSKEPTVPPGLAAAITLVLPKTR